MRQLINFEKRILLKRSPGDAVICGLLLPGGGSLYNNQKSYKAHITFQIIIPALLVAIGLKLDEPTYYSVAISSAAISKLWDMYNALDEAKEYNRYLAYE